MLCGAPVLLGWPAAPVGYSVPLPAVLALCGRLCAPVGVSGLWWYPAKAGHKITALRRLWPAWAVSGYKGTPAQWPGL